jgi:hypothetical protein
MAQRINSTSADSDTMTFSPISAKEAYDTARRNKASKARPLESSDDQPFVAPSFSSTFRIAPGDTIFTMGSCFARNIERFLAAKSFSVPMTTFDAPLEERSSAQNAGRSLLNKYNPFSMLNAINGAIGAVDLSQSIVKTLGGYLDLQLHTHKAVSHDRALSRLESVNALFHRTLKESRVAVVTLGLVEVWYDRESGLYLNHAPPRRLVSAHPERFAFEVLSPERVVSALQRLVALMKSEGHPDQRMVLTVSPVPLGRTFSGGDAATANQYSKSVLRSAAEVLTRENDHIDYFPSYESITLSDRSAAYQPDGMHVKPEAVRFNVNRMMDTYCRDANGIAGKLRRTFAGRSVQTQR